MRWFWYWYSTWASLILRIRVVRFVCIYTWAFIKTVQSVCQYLLGIRERVRMGMTFEQASDRSHRTVIGQIEKEAERCRAETDLARHRIEQIKKTVFERDSGNGVV